MYIWHGKTFLIALGACYFFFEYDNAHQVVLALKFAYSKFRQEKKFCSSGL